jgi:hypothetical protein
LKRGTHKRTCLEADRIFLNAIASQKINVDNKVRFCYLDSYWFRLIDASICCPAAEADIQFAIFPSYAPKKQCLIFFFIFQSLIFRNKPKQKKGKAMNLDFHYYGTYVAARLAGYDFESAQMIAHSAQYVDDSKQAMLQDSSGKPYIQDFNAVPTCQEMAKIAIENFIWSEELLKQLADIWIPFHFLPGNYGENVDTRTYTGRREDRGNWYSWKFDGESEQKFKLLVLPNSILVKSMINDIVKNHTGKNHTLQMTGLRLHVLADSWAHMYHVGLPAWFVNNSAHDVWEIHGESETKVKWNRIWPWSDQIIESGEDATPNMPAYNSIVYHGHGRMGHLPDYPWIKYKYRPQWSDTDIVKDNHSFFLQAIKQMVRALECVKNKTPYDVYSYADLPADAEELIRSILGTRGTDQCIAWKNNIDKMKINGEPMRVPEEYDKNKWLNEAKQQKSDLKNTSYYLFNRSALSHLDYVKEKLEENNLYIDCTPPERIVTTKLKNKEGYYIGNMHKELQYYPKMEKTGVDLQIIKPTSKRLSSGDVVKIKTTESRVGQYNYLGAWSTHALYYYKRDYNVSKQKWRIEKTDTSKDDIIRAGDRIRFKNLYYEKKPYMSTYKYFLGGTYLTTQADSSDDKAIWTVDSLSQIDREDK